MSRLPFEAVDGNAFLITFENNLCDVTEDL